MPRDRINVSDRYGVLERCNFACFYCGLPAHLGIVQLQVEHVIPVAHGGTNDPWNLVAACRECNAGKSDVDPAPDIIAAAQGLYMAWPGRSRRVRICLECSRPWIPDWQDDEPSDDCWACIRAWCEGMEWGRVQGARP